ncbi:MAG TPA: DUF4058 family protein [Gemmataceae bacterium]|jgi:hypothetical protein|nr:DUF4058 family protein [Gemmataceae bacterium]
MPIHDWTRMQAGDFHHFHQRWIGAIADALNSGQLPPGYLAMAEQVAGGPIPDVVTLQSRRPTSGKVGGVAINEKPPTAQMIRKSERWIYTQKANRVAIRHGRGEVVAIIEIVSPGNKGSQRALQLFLQKAAEILSQGVHFLFVDLFPPTPRDPQGLHNALWAYICDDSPESNPQKPLTVASYLAEDVPTAYVEPVAVGDVLPSLPIFLNEDEYIPAPLEETYMQSWTVYPAMLKEIMESGSTHPPTGD